MLFWLREISVLFYLGSYVRFVFFLFFFFLLYNAGAEAGARDYLGLGFFNTYFFPWAHSRTGNNFFSTHSTISWNPAGLCRTHLWSCPLGRHWGLPHLIWCFFFFIFSFFEWGKKKSAQFPGEGSPSPYPSSSSWTPQFWCWKSGVCPFHPSAALVGQREVIWCVGSCPRGCCVRRGVPKPGGSLQTLSQGLHSAPFLTSPYCLPLPDRHNSSLCHHVRHRCFNSCTRWACFKRDFWLVFLFWLILVAW